MRTTRLTFAIVIIAFILVALFLQSALPVPLDARPSTPATYFSPLDTEQLVCLAAGALIGIALVLLVLSVLSVLSHRRYRRAAREGRIIQGIRP